MARIAAEKFVRAFLLHGRPHQEAIATTLFEDQIQQLGR